MSLNESIIMATRHFGEKVLDTEINVVKEEPFGNMYCASIDVIGEVNYNVFVCIDDKSLQKMSSVFLFVDEPDEDTKYDLVCEIANIIVGRAKVEASEKLEYKFDISTPEFIGVNQETPSGEIKINFSFKDGEFVVIAKRVKSAR